MLVTRTRVRDEALSATELRRNKTEQRERIRVTVRADETTHHRHDWNISDSTNSSHKPFIHQRRGDSLSHLKDSFLLRSCSPGWRLLLPAFSPGQYPRSQRGGAVTSPGDWWTALTRTHLCRSPRRPEPAGRLSSVSLRDTCPPCRCPGPWWSGRCPTRTTEGDPSCRSDWNNPREEEQEGNVTIKCKRLGRKVSWMFFGTFVSLQTAILLVAIDVWPH